MSKTHVVLAVALLVAGATSASAQAIQDAVVVDPDAHRVALDNEHVRVLRALGAHGQKSAMHSHPPLVLVSLGTGRVRFTFPDGKKELFDLYPGMVVWIDGAQHAWEVVAGEVNVVAVEVKAAKAAKAK
jgi:quercetin dioxygenase-like cupin family protein